MNRDKDDEPTKEDVDETNFMPPALIMFRGLNVARQAIQDAEIALIEAAEQQAIPPGIQGLNARQIYSGKYKKSPRKSPARKNAPRKSPARKPKAKKSPTKSKAKRSRR
jgi:hypothetical protein